MGLETYDFGHVLGELKAGKKATRKGWNAKGMWIELLNPSEGSDINRPYLIHVSPRGVSSHYKEQHDLNKSAWLPSNSDLLADDWRIIE